MTTAASLSPAEVDARLADPRIDDILARLDAPGGYDGFIEAVKGAGCCRRPLRLEGRITRIEGDKRTVTFDTKDLPDRVLLKACGSRRETLCPPCSAVYRADAFQLVAAGLRGGKGVDESVADHPAVLVTLTAPSFGAVHRRGKDGRCHPRRKRCPHGVAVSCAKRHGEYDRVLGQALCASCYDYEGAVLFNLSVSELWRRTSIYILRALGELNGMSVRQVGRSVRLSYIKVVEFQRRGSVHVHAIVRVDAAGDCLSPPPSFADSGLLARAVVVAVRKVHAPVAGERGPEAKRVRWGAQLDVTLVTDAANGRGRAAAYLAKYSTKSSDAKGMLDHRMRAGIPHHLVLPPQLRRLVEAAWCRGEDSTYSELHLRAWAHTLGFRGHFATKSRRYSTTFGVLRAVRQMWRMAEDTDNRDNDPAGRDDYEPEVLDIREWQVTGMGYGTPGDAWIAEALARTARDARRALYEERMEQRGKAA